MRTIDPSSFSSHGTRTHTRSDSNDHFLTYCNFWRFCYFPFNNRKNDSFIHYCSYHHISHRDTFYCTEEIKKFPVYNEEFYLCIESFFYFRPIHHVPEILEVFRTSITIVDIICMFPDITREKRYKLL